MSRAKGTAWSRLDNAAKIFPSTSSKTDTSVFRFYCELNEPVVPEILEKAALHAVNDFPNFASVMRKGAFWYYLEASEKRPRVSKENAPLCSRLYEGDNTSLLFEFTYFGKRINLEIYHALSDGTGALQFLKTAVFYYLKAAHATEIPRDLVFLENDASYTEKNADGFSKYYKKQKGGSPPKNKRVYNLNYRRSEDETLQAIEAIVPVRQVIDLAHKHGTTLTVLLTALLIDAIHREMSLQGKKKTIVIMVPVNLRQFFPSETTRNFFGLIDISCDFSTLSGELPQIIDRVSKDLKEKLTAEFLSAKMNKFASLERNAFAKIAPLPLKNIALKCARALETKRETAVISNLGKVTMPEEVASHIDLFGVLASTRKIQLCLCSFGDKLQIGFTSAFISTDIQKNFIRSLTENGVTTLIRSNDYFKEEEPNA